MEQILNPTILESLQYQFTLKEFYGFLFINFKSKFQNLNLDLKSLGYNKLCIALLDDDILDYLIRMNLNNNQFSTRHRIHYIDKFLNENDSDRNKLNDDINEAFENVEKKKFDNNYTNEVFNVSFENISNFDMLNSRIIYSNRGGKNI